jgi:hypothetical protein
MLVELMAPPGGEPIECLDSPSDDLTKHYCDSKVNKRYVAPEFAKGSRTQMRAFSIAKIPGSYRPNVWRKTAWYHGIF